MEEYSSSRDQENLVVKLTRAGQRWIEEQPSLFSAVFIMEAGYCQVRLLLVKTMMHLHHENELEWAPPCFGYPLNSISYQSNSFVLQI